MRRSTFVCWGVATTLFLLTSGCGSFSRVNPAGWIGNARSGSKDAVAKIARNNPFRRSGTENDLGTAAGNGDQSSASHDDATLLLIAEELRDATPEMREEFTANFKDVDPEVVRKILKVRRMRIQREQEDQQLAQYPRRDPNRPLPGLGAPFPGSERRSVALPVSAEQLSMGASGRFSGNVQALGGGYGHSQAGLPRASGVNADYRTFDAGRARDSFRGQTYDLNVATRDSSATRQFPPGDQQRYYPTMPLTHADEFAARSTRAGANSNPARIAGVDILPSGIPSGNRMNPTRFSSDVPARQQSEALTQMIVAAEEQAFNAQTAWEQAERIPPGGIGDPEARERAIASRKQDYVEQQVFLRMLYLMSGQQARSLERIAGLEPADQEFWTQMLWSMANYFDFGGIPNEADRATQTIAQLRSAIQSLQENARLSIRNVSFCQKILSYGNYEPFSNDKFRPKQPVLLYAEIDNFTSERGTDGIYRTQLKSTIEIRRGGQQGGQIIESIKFDATTDLSRNHRRDYFHSYQLQIPAVATSGPYVLTLIVEDELSKRVATYSRNFTVE